MKKTDYDLIIVGGGMVGASLACALKNSPLKIAIIEAVPYTADKQPSYDDRAIAISYGSQRIFESIGIWSKLVQYSTPILAIHISDRGHFGSTRLSAKDEQVPALGQVILARSVGSVLQQQLAQQANLTLHCPASIQSLEQYDSHVRLTLDNEQILTARCLVVADGGRSTVRQQLGLSTHSHDYQQTAIIANISPERPHQNRAFERFTDSGPLALLPMADNRCSLVWTVNSGDEIALLALNDADFLVQLQSCFGYRLGELKQVGARQSYPLHLVQSDQPVQHRIVLIGNAAHTLHPVAGQGFNLGLRDVAALAEVLHDHADDCGGARALHEYTQWRTADQDNVITITNSLVQLFSQSNPIVGHLRGAALSATNALPPLKHWMAAKSMGLARKQPRLGRGLKL
jgi:2-octaprenyl-6-methoxyphenol hydroxylase